VYQPEPRGLLIAREAICGYYAARGDSVSPDSVLLTAGTSEAYSFVFRLLCNAGDEVLVPQPSYPLFDFLAELADVRLRRYPLLYDHGWQIDFHALQQALTERTRAIIVVHPNNPTGNFCKAREIALFTEICAAREMAIIADEVFLDYGIEGSAPQSFVANAGALTFTMSGLSKIGGLPQMKASWLVAAGPPQLRNDAASRLEVIADSYLSVSALVQLALPEFLRCRGAIQEQVTWRLRANLAELDRQLAAQAVCARLEVEGGWCSVLQLRGLPSDDEFAIQLLTSNGVLVHPGHFYEFFGNGHMVVSLLCPPEAFAAGIAKLLGHAQRR
jgi:aspartate/methionine/tyrosine aminotransferase